MTENLDFFNGIREVLFCEEMKISKGIIQHGEVSIFAHCCAVAIICYLLSLRFRKIDRKSLVRGALLHDFFLYDWHTEKMTGPLHGFSHPQTALKNSEERFKLNDTERNIIGTHMWPLTIRKLPRCREAWLVSAVDKICCVLETLHIFNYDNNIEKLFDYNFTGGLRRFRRNYSEVKEYA